MEAAEWAVRLIGGFYAVAGVFAMRSMAVADMIDRALDMIGGRPQAPKDKIRRILLSSGMVLTGASGVAAVLLSAWAPVLFAANIIQQWAWLAWARTAFAPEDAEDAAGRRSTCNAAIGYTLVGAVVLYLWSADRLWPLGTMPQAMVVLAALVAYAGYGWYLMRWRPRGSLAGFSDDDATEPDPDPQSEFDIAPSRIRFEVHPHRYPVVDADDGRPINHFNLLPFDLAADIEAWHDEYAGWYAERERLPPFPSPQDEARHRAGGEDFVRQLREQFGDGNVEGPFYVEI